MAISCRNGIFFVIFYQALMGVVINGFFMEKGEDHAAE
jgi:hypothetical protein